MEEERRAPCVLLVVEDDEDDLFFLRRSMEAAGMPCQVVVARDGEEAIEYLSKKAGHRNGTYRPIPTHLLLDLKLPRRPGLELLAWVRSNSRFSDMPVIVLTSSQLAADIAQAQQFGIDAYLVKPLKSSELLETVKKLAHIWQLTSVNEVRPK